MKSVLDLDSSEFADDFDGLKFASPQSDQSKDATFNFEIALVTAKAALRPQQAAVVARWRRSSHQLRARQSCAKFAARASAWTLESAGATGVDRGLDVGLQLGRYE